MIISFYNRWTEDIFNRKDTEVARKTCPKELWRIAQRKLDQLNAAVSLESLAIPPSNHLEALRGKRRGQHSLRRNNQYRICFHWAKEGPERIEITDYH